MEKEQLHNRWIIDDTLPSGLERIELIYHHDGRLDHVASVENSLEYTVRVALQFDSVLSLDSEE